MNRDASLAENSAAWCARPVLPSNRPPFLFVESNPLLRRFATSRSDRTLAPSSSPDESRMPRRRLGLEDQSIGSLKAKITNLFCSDPVGERTALDAMRDDAFCRVHPERSPITEVHSPSISRFFSTCLIRIIACQFCGFADR